MLIENLTKKYFSINRDNVIAINNISLSIEDGDFIAILGVSGSGKTTLMNCIGGFDKPTSGKVILDGLDLHKVDTNTMDYMRSQKIGYFFQDNNLIENMTVYDNIALPLKIQNHIYDHTYVDQVMSDLSINELKHRFPNEISAGQRQRVALARAIVKSPLILLADEPTGALDSKTAESIMSHFEKMNQFATIILITHDEKLAYQYAKRVIQIADGIIVSDERLKPNNKKENNTQVQNLAKRKYQLTWVDHLKLAFNDIKFKYTKSILSIILTMLALLMVSFSAVSASYDVKSAYINTVSNQKEVPFLALSKVLHQEDSFGLPYALNTGFSLDDLESINDVYQMEVIPKLSYAKIDLSGYATKDAQVSLFDDYKISGLSVINQNVLNEFRFDLVYGRLPEVNPNIVEIVLSNYHFELMRKFGFNQFINDVNTFSDLDHQVIVINDQDYLIVGIIDTKIDFKYDFLKDKQNEEQLNPDEFALYIQFLEVINSGVHKMIFTDESFIEEVYQPLIQKKIQFHSDEHIVLTHPDFTVNRIVDSIYHVDGIDYDIFSIQHTHTKYMYISISSVPNHMVLLNHIDAMINDLLNDFVNDYFDEIADQFESDTGKNSKEDYLQYIVSSEVNMYHPGKTSAYFRTEAYETVIPEYLENENIVFHSFIYTNQGMIEEEIPVVGIFFDQGFTYAVSDVLFHNIQEITNTGIDHVYVENGLAKKQYEMLISYQEDGNKTFSYEPVDIYMKGLNQLEERLELVAQIFFFGMIGLIVFTMILYYQMISTHIDQRMKDIGILKSLGVSNREIYQMFIIHALLLSLVAFVIHGVCLMLILLGFNAMMSSSVFVDLNIYSFSLVAIGITLGVSLIVPMVSAIIPLHKLAKKEPVDIIRAAYRS